MVKYTHKKMSYDEQDRLFDEFCGILQILKTKQEKKYFLKDLLGRGERIMLVRRFKIAKLLESGKTYRKIRESMGTSYTTISRVERLLNFGRGGYRKALVKLLKKAD